MWILSVPSAGQLYQTPDGVSLGAAIVSSSLPVLVTSPSFVLVYVNTFANTSFNGQATLNTDSFTYQPRVTYNQSTFSSIAVCTPPGTSPSAGGCTEFVADSSPAVLPCGSDGISITVMNPMTAVGGSSQASYTPTNASTLIPIQLVGTNSNGGLLSFAVAQLPISVSSSLPYGLRAWPSLS